MKSPLQSIDSKMRKVYHERPPLPQRVLPNDRVPEKATSTPSASPVSVETHSAKPTPPSAPIITDPAPASRPASSRRCSILPFSRPAINPPGFDNFVRLNLKRHINVRHRRHAYAPVNSLPSSDTSFSQIEDADPPQPSKDGNNAGPGLLEEEVVELMMDKNAPASDAKEDGRCVQ